MDSFEKELEKIKMEGKSYDYHSGILKELSLGFFDKHNNIKDDYKEHDNYFTKLGRLRYGYNGSNFYFFPKEHVEKVFDYILSFIYEWEEKNGKRIHKGTIYYFYGVICILNGEIEKGNLLMHQASDEDYYLGANKTPANSFVSLDDQNENQFFRQKVSETVKFLQKYIDKYDHENSSGFNMENLREKFLDKVLYKDESFFFIYLIYKLENIYKRINKKIRDNRLASFIETTIIFEFSKLFEVLIRKCINLPNQSDNLINYISKFCEDNQISLRLRVNNLGFLNTERENNFEDLIDNLVDKNYHHQLFIGAASNIEYDLTLTYVLRNFGGHKVQDQDSLIRNFDSIISSILNSIFIIIDKKL